ncbi:DNA polymerase-3 subunit gamma/tau [Mycoplasmopsis mustelae]|uniref:DNA polymerase III subunit gamma/tau n=1 Tax=Mycoplasmopsis mustelae TaxID=171289 RepID=A0A4R7UDP7_9BACT|nr:DNA polymerase III subunit gamma/tau [Mycoplasmopsis mustelae]TDV23560.1 DNA polymerase-3 subunit gamma/tau [Mycoplasmopsis mustelae]
MQHKALYRKYRPKTFSEVVGQEHIVESLKNILKSRKINHAYLFCGPKGTGKTSVAKIFANTLNCMHTTDVTLICEDCLKMSNNNFDIIEMDAASNNGVDEIRDLKDKVEQAPINSKFKIYIIDEVHMMTKSAFNALLKTLEEPPKHAIFILATTDPQKIPLTILSRVQRFNFKRVSQNNIIQQLKFVLDNEKIKYESDALKAIAAISSGGLRDALSLSEQASSFNDNKILLDDVQKYFGLLSNKRIITLLNDLKNDDLLNIIKTIRELKSEGIDPKILLTSTMDVIKEWVLFNKTFDTSLLNILDPNDIGKINLSIDLAIKLLKKIYEILIKLPRSESPFSIIEVGLINCIDLNNFYKPKPEQNKKIQDANSISHTTDELEFKATPKIQDNKNLHKSIFSGDDFFKSKFAIDKIKKQTTNNTNKLSEDLSKNNNNKITNNIVNNEEMFEKSTIEIFDNTLETQNFNNQKELEVKYQWENENEFESILNILLWIKEDKENRNLKDKYTSLKNDAEFSNTRVDLNRYFEWFKNTKIISACENAIIFSVDNDELLELLNKNKYKVDLQKFIDYVYSGGYKWLYFLNSNKQEKIRQLYIDYINGKYVLGNPIHKPDKLITVIPNQREDHIEASKYIHSKTWK